LDALKTQFARIQQQLSQLTASQRMLAGSLLAVMVLTLLFWGRYAGTAEMEPVLDQALKPEELARITGELRSKGIDCKVVGDRVLVSADRKLEALANLTYAGAMPQDTRSAYDQIISRISPWDSESSSAARRLDAKSFYLSQVIRHWPGVASADVIIDATNDGRRIGGGGRQATAAVHILLQDRTARADKQMIQSAASTVAGAHAGLTPGRVTVVVNGATHRVRDRDSQAGGFSGDEYLAAEREISQEYTQKINSIVGWLGPNVMVAVAVEVSGEDMIKTDEKYNPDGTLQKEAETESETTEETAPDPSSGEPGAQTNTGLTVAPPQTPGGPTSSKERSNTRFETRFGKTFIQTRSGAGRGRVLSASVRVPRSFFLESFKADNPTVTKDPTTEELEGYAKPELDKIRADVKNCTNVHDDARVTVALYRDVMPTMLAATTVTAAGGAAGKSGLTAMVGGHVKEIALAGLALISLYVVSSIAKKSSPAPAVAPPIELSEAAVLSDGEEIAGDVSEGNAMLDGMELDADSVQAQQMVEQVSTMVKEDPEAAANLVKRWLNRT
jgi:flagellar biosynthesis/type III secretory pathway M-ring protein FliF/YscJ